MLPITVRTITKDEREKALDAFTLGRINGEGLPAYLESSNPRNIPFYERHGFEVIGRIQSGKSPVVTPMLRRAR